MSVVFAEPPRRANTRLWRPTDGVTDDVTRPIRPLPHRIQRRLPQSWDSGVRQLALFSWLVPPWQHDTASSRTSLPPSSNAVLIATVRPSCGTDKVKLAWGEMRTLRPYSGATTDTPRHTEPERRHHCPWIWAHAVNALVVSKSDVPLGA